MAFASAPPRPLTITSVRFWLFIVGLLLVWSVEISIGTLAPTPSVTTINAGALASSIPSVLPVQSLAYKGNDIKNTRNCMALCKHCGCQGFYCGEECICECNNENADTECIGTMQRNARKLAIPFELLIQGPSDNRFVRNALQFEQNAERRSISAPLRHKRSTVVIYKPPAQNSLDGQFMKKATTASANKMGLRKKRSVPRLDWFSDLANNLVRPAPRVSYQQRKTSDTVEEPTQRRRAVDGQLDRSWFAADNFNTLIRPAPMFKRQSAAAASAAVVDVDVDPDADADADKRDDPDTDEDEPIMSMARIPQAIKDTIANMQEGALKSDYTNAMRMNMKPVSDVFGSGPKGNLDIFRKSNMGDSLQKALSNLKTLNSLPLPAPPKPTPLVGRPPKFNMPWFRPGRFLQRVDEAIN